MIPFHKVLISSGIVFCGAFALWAIAARQLVLAAVFAVLAVALAYYLRHLKRFIGR